MLVSDQSSARPAAISPAYRALAAGVAFSVAFTLLIWLLGDLLDAVPDAGDAGASWYYWKLIDPTLTSRLTAWGFYLLHQVSFWAVALMLVWVLLMENPRRGLVFGKKIAFPKRVTSVARRYHGYYFAWATVYTFWYHPMEATSGHLIGFLYMFLLLVQGSLFFTRAHVNRWWTLFLEVAVLAPRHAGGDHAGRGHVANVRVRVRGDLRHHADARVELVALGARPGARCLRRGCRGGLRSARLGAAGPRWRAYRSSDYAAVFALAGLIGGALGLIRLMRGKPVSRLRTGPPIAGDPMEVAGIEPAS